MNDGFWGEFIPAKAGTGMTKKEEYLKIPPRLPLPKRGII
jgi:hypothetical protein